MTWSRPFTQTVLPLIAGVSMLVASQSTSAALLWMDNFNAPDTTNFDGADLTGRLSGAEAANTTFRSWGFQQHINNGQLLMPFGNNGVRFGGETTRFDWAGSASGAEIIADGGFVVAFDWFPKDNTDNEWVSFQVGTINADNGNLTNDDYGILFRNNGGTERFRNAPSPSGNQGAGLSFTATPAGVARHVEITYLFDSFADGSPVNVISKVDGFTVANDTFNWDGNGGQMRMEMGNGVNDTRIDNFSVSTVPEPTSLGLVSVGLLGMLRRRRK